MRTIEQKRSSFIHLRWACRAQIIFTALVSVWANILHAGPFALVPWIFAALPPFIVLGGYEMVSRIPLLKEQPWYIRFVRPIATVIITGGGAWLSYFHQKDAVLKYTRGDEAAAFMMPILIDGLMVIASVSVSTINQHLMNLDAAESSAKAGAQRKITETPTRKAEPKKESDRDRIAKILARSPELTVPEIARLAGTKESYTYNVVGQLRKLAAPEMVTA